MPDEPEHETGMDRLNWIWKAICDNMQYDFFWHSVPMIIREDPFAWLQGSTVRDSLDFVKIIKFELKMSAKENLYVRFFHLLSSNLNFK